MNKILNNTMGTKFLKSAFTNNQYLSWIVRIILVIYAAFGPTNLPPSILAIFDNVVFRVFMVLLIIYMCYVDEASAILLAVCFIISIQYNIYHQNINSSLKNENENENEELNNVPVDHLKQQNTNDMLMDVQNSTPTTTMQQADYSKLSPEQDNMSLYSNVNDTTMLSSPSSSSSCQQQLESFQNLSNNNNNTFLPFTTEEQLITSQNNIVANNQMTQVQTWTNELGPQGLNHPMGYNMNNCNLYNNNSTLF